MHYICVFSHPPPFAALENELHLQSYFNLLNTQAHGSSQKENLKIQTRQPQSYLES